jgi:hypothetical protein
MELVRNIPVEVSAEAVSKRLRIDKTLTNRIHGEDLVATANSLVDPKALFTIGYISDRNEDMIDLDGTRLTSHVLAKNLEKVGRVFPYIITIGSTLEDKASTYGMMERLFLENAADVALTLARVQLAKYVSAKYELGPISQMGPGQLDWPIQQQKELFSLFEDVQGKIGVRLTESLMMVPRKSVSGVMFPKEATFTACQLCPRENCPSRQAEYSEALRKSHGLEV